MFTEDKDPSRALLFGAAAIAAVLALVGGFLFFSNVPERGAANEMRERIAEAAPVMDVARIDKIIAQRQAMAPKPVGVEAAREMVADARSKMGSSDDTLSAYLAADSAPAAGEANAGAAPAARVEAKPDESLAEDMYRRGLYTEALDEWRRAATAGDRDAAYRLGIEYLDGKPLVVQRDAAEGAKWIAQSAEANDARAQFELASLYEYGRGVPLDLAEAGRWYLKAAERGHVQAQYNVATMLETGEGLAQDRLEALKFYILAGKEGFRGVALDEMGRVDSNAPDALDNLRRALPADEVREAERRAAAFEPIRD